MKEIIFLILYLFSNNVLAQKTNTQNAHALQEIYDFAPQNHKKRLKSWCKPVFNKQGDVIQNTLYYYEDEARTQLKSIIFLYNYEFYP